MMWFITRSPLREKTSLPLLAGGGQEGGVHRHAHTLHDTPTESLRANALTLRLPRKRGSGFFITYQNHTPLLQGIVILLPIQLLASARLVTATLRLRVARQNAALH